MGSVRRIRFEACAALIALGAITHVAAAEPTDAARAEARERFDRGLKLFNQKDDVGALAEFQRTYELVPHPLVLYNIALVYATMKRPVEAVDTLDKLLENPAGLDADKLQRAKSVRAEQAANIGQLEVKTNVESASVEVDGVARGKTPLAKPLRVSRGNHVVGAIAAGRIPSRREVLVASGAVAKVELELLAADGRLADLEVRSRTLDADVSVDGQRVGKTPLPASLALAPGNHSIEVSRKGYFPIKKDVTLGAGTKGAIDANLSVDSGALSREGGRLAIDVSEPNARLSVDGESVTGSIELPAGTHLLSVERAGFLPAERRVDVARGVTTHVTVELEPTPETRAAYVDRTTSQRRWGYIAVGGGALLMAGSGGFLIWNKSKERSAKSAYDDAANRLDVGGSCYSASTQDQAACQKDLQLKLGDLEDIRSREKFGWIGLGVGAVSAGLGAYLLLSNDDPDRYEPSHDSDVFGKLRLAPVGFIDRKSTGLGVVGVF